MATKPRNLKTRADDQRGARKGTTTMKPAHGGSIGQAPFIPTPRDRAFVVRHCFSLGNVETARRLGICSRSLLNHFAREIRQSKVMAMERLNDTAMRKALNGDGAMIRYILSRRSDDYRAGRAFGRQSAPQGSAANVNVNIDIRALLTGMSEEEIGVAIKLFDQLITAAGARLDTGAGGSEAAVSGPAAGNPA